MSWVLHLALPPLCPWNRAGLCIIVCFSRLSISSFLLVLSFSFIVSSFLWASCLHSQFPLCLPVRFLDSTVGFAMPRILLLKLSYLQSSSLSLCLSLTHSALVVSLYSGSIQRRASFTASMTTKKSSVTHVRSATRRSQTVV